MNCHSIVNRWITWYTFQMLARSPAALAGLVML